MSSEQCSSAGGGRVCSGPCAAGWWGSQQLVQSSLLLLFPPRIPAQSWVSPPHLRDLPLPPPRSSFLPLPCREGYRDAYLAAHFEVPGEMFSLAMEAKRSRGMGVVGSTQNILDFIAAK